MTTPSRADQPTFQVEHSRLGQSLLRLHRTLEQSRTEQENVESLMKSWQARWSTRRDEIARRLELIESQLQQMGRSAPPAPRLSVVGAPADGGEKSSMRAFTGG